MITILNEALRYFRQRRGLTQNALGRLSGVKQAKISQFENAQVDLQISTLQRIAKAMDLELILVPRPHVRQIEELVLNKSIAATDIPSTLELYQILDEEDDE